jgi:hypothetical protein
MSDMSIVDEAAGWADFLVRREHRGPGDTVEAARQRAARKHRLPEQLLWALRYRKPKRIWADLYVKLEQAAAAECERQEEKLRHELEITKRLPPTADRLALIAETEALLGSASSQAERASAQRAPAEA